MMDEDFEDGHRFEIDDQKSKSNLAIGEMDVDGSNRETIVLKNNSLVKNIGAVVHDLRGLGFASMTEDAYASAIFSLLKVSITLYYI